MNGLMNSLKRFVSNKNTVTILGVILVLVLLYRCDKGLWIGVGIWQLDDAPSYQDNDG